MEIKYEAVFGDQSLFDDAHNEATHATSGHGFYKVNEDGLMEYLSNGVMNGNKNETLTAYLIAERRIIRTPTWTVADQKAGKLPEVGCVVMVTSVDECASVAAINNDAVCVVFNDGEFTTLHKSVISPIETPEEKAQREEDEWVNKAWSETAAFAGVAQDERDRLRIHLRHIYKAQLSGKLQAPKGGE